MYNNQLIEVLFFFISNGYIENVEVYWISVILYLKSVKSLWDKKFLKYKVMKIFIVLEFE